MTDKPFDPNKPVVCRDGCAAEIVARDLDNSRLAYVRTCADGKRMVVTVIETNGRVNYCSDAGYDLVNVPERVSRWSRVMGPISWGYALRSEAERYAGQTVEFIFEDDKLVEVKLHDADWNRQHSDQRPQPSP